MSSPSHPSSKGKELEVPYTPSTPPTSPAASASQSSSSSAAPKAKRRRLEPAGPSHEVGEPSVVRVRSNPGSWAWYPDMLRGWIREERVPSFESLPRLPYPLEQAFAGFVAKMDREIRNMREAAGAITGLLRDGLAMGKELKSLRTELAMTNQVCANLVGHVTELEDRVAIAELGLAHAEAGLVQAQIRIAELEAQEEADEEEEEEPEEVPEADEAEDQDGDGEVDD